MNRPSRTDDDTLEHPDWNQNPPFLAADLTTCEDLNGIANAREHRRPTGAAADGADGRGDEMNYQTLPRLQPHRRAAVSGGWKYGFHPRHMRVHGGDDHTRLLKGKGGGPDPSRSSLWGWLSWLLSVVGCSAIISALKSPEAAVSFMFASKDGVQTLFKRSVRATRRSTCPSGGLADEDKYNTPLHVGALFIILAVSFFACAFPLIVSHIPGLRIPRPFFFAVRHFGTGVLLATAFVHLLPTAFTLLGNPCLSSFWVDDYPAMPGAIALAGIFLITIIEMVFQPARHMSHTPDDAILSPSANETTQPRDPASCPLELAPSDGSRRNSNRNSSSIGRTLPRIARDERVSEAQDREQQQQQQQQQAGGEKLAKRVDEESRAANMGGSSSMGSGIALTPAQKHQKDILQCMMLEVGILFHSVFIGMTLSVSVGHEFVILLIAIAFHQTFEGLALGSRIASIAWPPGSLQPWMMALAYGCTTPTGQAIGIATHRLYSPDSEFGLVLVGTMNAISSGLLVFGALIELLAEDFLCDESWRILRGRKRVYACLLVFGGAFGMSLVGAWA